MMTLPKISGNTEQIKYTFPERYWNFPNHRRLILSETKNIICRNYFAVIH